MQWSVKAKRRNLFNGTERMNAQQHAARYELEQVKLRLRMRSSLVSAKTERGAAIIEGLDLAIAIVDSRMSDLDGPPVKIGGKPPSNTKLKNTTA